MAALAFILECAAVAALLATGASVVTLGAALALRPLTSRLPASLRADLAFVSATVPAVVAIAGTASAALPPIASLFGLAADHCQTHGHHLHLCIVHATGLRPSLAVIGALALATFAFRGCCLLSSFVAMERRLGHIERLGTVIRRGFDVIAIPGAPRMCHAAGVWHGRVLVSKRLIEQLAERDVRCALAHEEAHLRRRDPLANLMMSVAGLFLLPPLTAHFQRTYRSAAEQACDADAARAVGDPALVAEALVNVAAAQRGTWQQGAAIAAFGELDLETRVRRLLERGAPDSRPARALPFAAAGALAVQLPILAHAASIHHAIETLLHHLF
jgi:Zn-dependent protease with chaperone function